MSLGDFDASTVVYGKFTTYRPSTGASFTLGGTPALSVYKDNSTTQSTTGVTLTADFDSVTGLNHFAIDTSADGSFYSAGSFFDVVITTGTVDSVSVTGAVVASFTIRKTASIKPTTAGRSLDVSAGGEAGIDWANIGSPTTAVNLSATNIDVDQVVASVSGAVGSVTGAVGSVTGLTAATVHSDLDDIQARLPAALVGGRIDANVGAISSDTTAADNAEAFFDGTGYAGTNNVIPTVTTLTNLPAITANWLTAAGTAADFTTEIQSGLATAAALATVDDFLDTEIADIQARLPAALVGGRMDSNVGAISGDATAADNLESYTDGTTPMPVNATQISGDATAADNLESALDGTGGVTITAALTGNITGNLSGSVGSVTGAVGSVTGLTAATVHADLDDIQTRLPAALVSGRIDASVGAMAANTITAAATAADYLAEINAEVDTAIADVGLTTTITGRIDAAVSTRATQTSVDDLPTNAELATALGTADDAVLAQVALVKAVTDKLDDTVELTSDGYIFTANALEQAPTGGSDPWATALPGAYGAGTAGKIIGDNINATISSRSTQASVDTIDDFLDTEVAAIKAKTDSLTFTVAGQIDANVTNWKGSTAPNMTGDAYARLGAPAGASVSADIAAVQSDADNLQTRIPAALVSGRMDASVGAMAADVLTASALAADAVTEIQSGLATAAALDTVDNFLDTEIAAIKAKTDNLPAAPAAVGDIPTATQNADALLNRDMSAVSDTNSRSPLNALRQIRNGFTIAGSTLTVLKEDDVSEAYTRELTTDANADPITGVS